jgi:benzoyl-CoA reductase/2-hydroxyglutaryl-CoA dehydratase subunit BcrC/BadD/HgdB
MMELLRLCGFEAQDIESDLPRIEKTFHKLGITAEDIERGKQRLNKYYDTELKGVRKILRLLVKELVNSVLAREEGKKKIIYGFMGSNYHVFGSALASKSKEVYAPYQCWSVQAVLGCIFDKIVPILEAAEKKWPKAGAVAHCGNVKTLVGLFALDLIPKPDLMVTSGYLCETAPKTLDLLHELYDIPVCCYDTCQDRAFSEYGDPKRVMDFTVKGTRRLTRRLQEVVGFEITDDMLWEVLRAKGRLGAAVQKLESLMQTSDPMPISATHVILWVTLTQFSLSIDALEEAVDAINTLYQELQERANKGLGAVEKGAPRILALLPPQTSDPRLEHLVGELGMALVALDAALFAPDGRTSPDSGELKDPYQAMALRLQSSLFTDLRVRVPIIIGACRSLNIDGVLDRNHVGCRTCAGDALIIKDAVEKELGIPVLLLEWEGFDPRAYNHEQYKRRLEAFKTMLKASRG